MYIHNHYSNYLKEGPSIANLYNERLVKNQYEVAISRLKKKLVTSYKQNIPNISNDEEFFKLLEDIQNNVLPAAAEKMASALETTNISRVDIATAKMDVNKLEEVITRFRTVLKQMTNSPFLDDPIPILTADMLKKGKIQDFKEKYRNAYLTNGTTFKVDQNYSRAIVSHQNEINKLLANMNALNELTGKSNIKVPSEVKSDLIQSFLYSTFFTLNRMVGFVSEDILADSINNLTEKEIKSIGLDIISDTAATGKSSIFNVQTQDVSLSIDLSKDLKQGENEIGNIKVNLPGVTLKRTNVKKDNIADIHIKSNTELGKLLNNSDLGETHLKAFYNSYANYNRRISSKEKAELSRSEGNDIAMANMYEYLHASFLPLALGGSLDKDDFAYYMVINDRVFNIIEIIEKIADGQDRSMVSSDLSTQQTKTKNYHSQLYNTYKNVENGAIQRSNEILNYIQKLKITMELSLALDKIKNF